MSVVLLSNSLIIFFVRSPRTSVRLNNISDGIEAKFVLLGEAPHGYGVNKVVVDDRQPLGMRNLLVVGWFASFLLHFF